MDHPKNNRKLPHFLLRTFLILWPLSLTSLQHNSYGGVCGDLVKEFRAAILKNAELWKVSFKLNQNSFNIYRGANEYMGFFGSNFVTAIQNLPDNSHWLDAGAGMGKALKQFAEGVPSGDGSIIQIKSTKLTALGIRKPKDAIKILDRQFNYLEGKLESLSKEKIGPCDLITDVYGPFSYAQQIDLVLNKYLALLKKGGSLFVVAADSRTVIDQKHPSEGLKQYLAAIPGTEVQWLNSEAFMLKKIEGGVSTAPKLKRIKFSNASPPFREYLMAPP